MSRNQIAQMIRIIKRQLSTKAPWDRDGYELQLKLVALQKQMAR